ncbi:MAG: peptidylprolyl isomerase, partial [Proteobacteria bacterium]|nr:peptidylprolyl isomerase [Pseudomonadota bacterium]
EPQAFSGCGHGPAPAARRAASAPPIFVNGVEIPESDIAREAQNHNAVSGPEARAAAARALVIRELLLQRARSLGLAPDARADERGREETSEEALVRALLDAEVETPEPGEEECRRVYNAAPHRFAAPELYEASHILFAPAEPGEVQWAAAHDRAAEAICALSAGGNFSALAMDSSDCPSAAQGGSLGQLQPGDLAPEIEGALLALRPGEVASAPVRTRHGWHVVRLDRRIPSQTLPYDLAVHSIREMLRTRAWTAAAARYVEGLAQAANVEGLRLVFGGGGDV